MPLKKLLFLGLFIAILFHAYSQTRTADVIIYGGTSAAVTAAVQVKHRQWQLAAPIIHSRSPPHGG